MRVRKSPPLFGRCRVPGDKSISHRALLLGSIADGISRLSNFPNSEACQTTRDLIGALGVRVETPAPNECLIYGRGLYGLRAPAAVLDCRNSGTALRLILGLLAGQRFESFLTGSAQLLFRPMDRVVTPLRQFGAHIIGRENGRFAPLGLAGAAAHSLRGGTYTMPMASAQVKSCLLLLGLYAQDALTVFEPGPTRDHTERLLTAMGATLRCQFGQIRIEPAQASLRPLQMRIPGDMSSAAFVLGAAVLVPGSHVCIEDVGINATRTGLISALLAMGADIRYTNQREVDGEPVADLEVRHSPLQAQHFSGPDIVTMIDELPLLALCATQAQGVTTIGNAAELRVKETDRIHTTATELTRLGARIATTDDGFRIEGPTPFLGSTVQSHQDHRLAMGLAVAGCIAQGTTEIENAAVTRDSFPSFVRTLQALGASLVEVPNFQPAN